MEAGHRDSGVRTHLQDTVGHREGVVKGAHDPVGHTAGVPGGPKVGK
jgi:hypothetical protein